MKIIDCEQGSSQWFGAKCGRPSASNMSLVVTSRGEPTKGETRKTYLCKLVAERLTHSVEMDHCSAATERGQNLEPRARRWYETMTGRAVQQVGFITDDAGRFGCSPDGLMPDRGLEVKCPLRRQMVKTLLGGKVPTEYIVQIQFSMWLTGARLWDFVLYTPEPEIPSVIWPVERDDRLWAAFAEHVPAFCGEIDAAVKQINELSS